MKKTLLLCFIHGFKGGDDTFGTGFPERLRELVAEQLPKVNVRVIVYPKYETRGDLAECVDRFRDWLLEKVIDIEVNSGTPSPTIDPSVRTILIGHSMGGIVAAETGFTWASSHLEFVGCLARGEELRRRVAYMSRVSSELGVGFGNLYTRLGKAAPPKQISMASTVVGNQRTFCNLPAKTAAGTWLEAVNDAATDETLAHMTMFEPAQNPGYEKLTTDAAGLIASWTRNEWYESSAEQAGLLM
ncbi:hypothetical protein MAPG_00315 [Magnaporthiopsis poae ATCC 64411]|uniref:AB hydrolase-1 domain-containing protein n=1 Tax=Magnaporthiopsis poae (strain ATCC 64411 / 73-15) TaxID=644358 RepID=A0A0C4DKN7_MAGP6|nr:hypothetical protein MAPG_00315 [Magnaporthiopsis poae ATCC 64411]